MAPPTGEGRAGQSVAGRARGVMVLLRPFWDQEGRAWEPAQLRGSRGVRSRPKAPGPSGAARLER